MIVEKWSKYKINVISNVDGHTENTDVRPKKTVCFKDTKDILNKNNDGDDHNESARREIVPAKPTYTDIAKRAKINNHEPMIIN